MLTPYRRHKAGCKFTSRKHRSCGCPIWVQGILHGEKIRESLDLTNWEAAAWRIRELEIHGKGNTMSLLDAMDRFIKQGETNGLAEDTIKKYKLLKRELDAFFGDLPLRSLTADDVARFRESWKMSNVTARKKIERVRSFFKFAIERDWLEKNPAKSLKLPKETHLPTLPFTADEWEKIRWAVDLYPDRPVGRRKQVLAFVLLLRHTGLRIRDVVCFERTRIDAGQVFLYTQKTGVPVMMPLHPDAIAAVDDLPPGNKLFWSGEANPKSAVGNWQRTLRQVFKDAGVVNGHAQRFRDTFSVRLLEKGVPIETVAVLLGNTVEVCEKHYAPWVKSRQDALTSAVQMAWA